MQQALKANQAFNVLCFLVALHHGIRIHHEFPGSERHIVALGGWTQGELGHFGVKQVLKLCNGLIVGGANEFKHIERWPFVVLLEKFSKISFLHDPK